MNETILIRPKSSFRLGEFISKIIWFILSVVEVVLLIRFALKLMNLGVTQAFPKFIYLVTDKIVSYFQFIVSQRIAGMYVEWATLATILAVWIIAHTVIFLLTLNSSSKADEIPVRVDQVISNNSQTK